MKKIIMQSTLVTGAMLLLLLSACSKGSIVDEPVFGFISINKLAATEIKVIKGDTTVFSANGVVFNALAGPNRFRFYEGEVLSLDTMLVATPNYNHPYVLFKPNGNTPIRIYDSKFNGFDKEVLPDTGFIKISIANFSEQFPAKVNVYITTNTIIDGRQQEIQTAEFLNVSGSFPPVTLAKLGSTTSGIFEHKLTLILKDPEMNTVLMTKDLILPTGAGKGSKNLPYTVYLVYIDGKDAVQIMMNK